jgi:hypothetical protein
MSMMRTPSSGRREGLGEGRKLLGDFMVIADQNGAPDTDKARDSRWSSRNRASSLYFGQGGLRSRLG